MHKNELIHVFGGSENIPDNFTRNTGITEGIVIPRSSIEEIQTNKKLQELRLENASSSINATIRCSNEFSAIVSQRREDIASTDLRNKNKKYRRDLLIGVFFLVLCIGVLKGTYSYREHENACNALLLEAKKIATDTTKNWDGVSTYKVPGPLNIDLVQWRAAKNIQRTIDSANVRIDSIKAVAQKIFATQDSILVIAKQQHDSVRNTIDLLNQSMSDSIIEQSKVQAQSWIDKATTTDEERSEHLAKASEIMQQAKDLVQSLEAQHIVMQQHADSNLMLQESSIQIQQDSVRTEYNKKIKAISVTIPHVSVPYDIENPHLGHLWKIIQTLFTFFIFMMLIGIIFNVILIVMTWIKILKRIANTTEYHPVQLKKIAITQSMHYDKTTIGFIGGSLYGYFIDIQKIIGKYDIRALCNIHSFTLTESLLTEKEKTDHNAVVESPLLYALYDSKTAIIFGGYSKETNVDISSTTVEL
jgi:hypothetical protein